MTGIAWTSFSSILLIAAAICALSILLHLAALRPRRALAEAA